MRTSFPPSARSATPKIFSYPQPGRPITPSIGQSSAGKREGRFRAQPIEIVGIFVATDNGEDARPQNVRQQVNYAQRIARVANNRRNLFGNTKLALGRRQSHHAAIRRDPPPIESGCDLLAVDSWKSKGSDLSSVMADVAGEDQVDRMASATNS